MFLGGNQTAIDEEVYGLYQSSECRGRLAVICPSTGEVCKGSSSVPCYTDVSFGDLLTLV